MTEKVFVFYDLSDGVDIEEYKEWSRTVDQPTCNASPICHSIEIYLLESKIEGKSFYRVAESIEVESWDAWEAALKSEDFAKMSEEWPRFGNGDSAVVVTGTKI
jgi:beta-galactosidase GanA